MSNVGGNAGIAAVLAMLDLSRMHTADCFCWDGEYDYVYRQHGFLIRSLTPYLLGYAGVDMAQDVAC